MDKGIGDLTNFVSLVATRYNDLDKIRSLTLLFLILLSKPLQLKE